MQIQITVQKYETFNVPFQFPIYRRQTISEDEHIYWKFYSKTKVTRIHEKIAETSILTYDDDKADFVRDMIRSENMLYGNYEYDIINEKQFDWVIQRLINVIHEA